MAYWRNRALGFTSEALQGPSELYPTLKSGGRSDERQKIRGISKAQVRRAVEIDNQDAVDVKHKSPIYCLKETRG